MFEIKKEPREIKARDGYMYYKDGEYLKAIYPLPSQDVSDYVLVPVEEYEATLVKEDEEVIPDEA